MYLSKKKERKKKRNKHRNIFKSLSVPFCLKVSVAIVWFNCRYHLDRRSFISLMHPLEIPPLRIYITTDALLFSSVQLLGKNFILFFSERRRSIFQLSEQVQVGFVECVTGKKKNNERCLKIYSTVETI